MQTLLTKDNIKMSIGTFLASREEMEVQIYKI